MVYVCDGDSKLLYNAGAQKSVYSDPHPNHFLPSPNVADEPNRNIAILTAPCMPKTTIIFAMYAPISAALPPPNHSPSPRMSVIDRVLLRGDQTSGSGEERYVLAKDRRYSDSKGRKIIVVQSEARRVASASTGCDERTVTRCRIFFDRSKVAEVGWTVLESVTLDGRRRRWPSSRAVMASMSSSSSDSEEGSPSGSSSSVTPGGGLSTVSGKAVVSAG